MSDVRIDDEVTFTRNGQEYTGTVFLICRRMTDNVIEYHVKIGEGMAMSIVEADLNAPVEETEEVEPAPLATPPKAVGEDG